ncbi:hypothetical protein [Actinomadura flavalba]|uniref:hypothetical protein n=1 Tax=Actinomadura flavalba TaxID=1120938 RepID=UPI0003665EAE|nr:hypothetical protein [Actinomadura flavalba]
MTAETPAIPPRPPSGIANLRKTALLLALLVIAYLGISLTRGDWTPPLWFAIGAAVFVLFTALDIAVGVTRGVTGRIRPDSEYIEAITRAVIVQTRANPRRPAAAVEVRAVDPAPFAGYVYTALVAEPQPTAKDGGSVHVRHGQGWSLGYGGAWRKAYRLAGAGVSTVREAMPELAVSPPRPGHASFALLIRDHG